MLNRARQRDVSCRVPCSSERVSTWVLWAGAGLAVLLPDAVAAVLLLSPSNKEQFLVDRYEYIDICVLLSLRAYSPCDSTGSCI